MLLWAGAAVQAAAPPAPIAAERARLKQLQADSAARQAVADKLARDAARLRVEIDQSTLSMVNVAAKIQAREGRLDGVEARLAKLQVKRGVQLAQLAARSTQIVQLLAALQNLSRQPPQLLLVRPDAAVNTARTAALLRLVEPRLQTQMKALQAELTAINGLKADLDSERDGYRLELAALQSDRTTLDTLRTEREGKRTSLLEQADTEAAKAQALVAEARTVKDLIATLEVQERRRARLLALPGPRLRPNFAAPPVAVAQAPPARVPQLPRSSSSPPPGLPQSRAPANPQLATLPPRTAAGFGNLPVRGEIVTGFGQMTATGPARGLSIRTRADATVTAPAAGRVVFAGPFRAYGQMLIISHGAGYHSLIAGLTRLDAQNQQLVQPGEPLGVMGADGDASTTLYFELRRGGDAVNPTSWLALAKRG